MDLPIDKSALIITVEAFKISEENAMADLIHVQAQNSVETPTLSFTPEKTCELRNSCLPSPRRKLSTRAIVELMGGRDVLSLWESNIDYRKWVAMHLADLKHHVAGYDMAGKLPLTLKLASLGVGPTDLIVDPAHAGGLLGASDAFSVESEKFLEIKGASPVGKMKIPLQDKRFGQDHFEFKHIRLHGTSWDVLVFVCRKWNPSDWGDVNEYDHCGMWLGTVTRKVYKFALMRAGKSEFTEQRVCVTPGGKNKRNWLGRFVSWIPFEDLTREWWEEKIM